MQSVCSSVRHQIPVFFFSFFWLAYIRSPANRLVLFGAHLRAAVDLRVCACVCVCVRVCVWVSGCA